MIGITVAFAGPVNMETARLVGQRFVAATFDPARSSNNLEWVYSGQTNRGETCFYVFNVGETGFVIVSADDRFRPITGYSQEGVFETENRSPELDFYLEKIMEARTSPHAVYYDDAENEWQSLLTKGKTISRNGGKGATYLCKTKWNQNSPYNLYSPEAGSGPGGRCYAGCVATAMSQVMRYWEHPLQGTGSHSYYSSYGVLSANFGATTYDWEHMPLKLFSDSPAEEIEAVALLMYHCGVAVNMQFSPNGSGAYSQDVPGVIQQYFSYSNMAELEYREYYSLGNWKTMLKQQFDLGWPVYYSGYSNSGGHAFVCDGYDDNDLFHFNWGWGGSSDGWFVIDEIDYANWAGTIKNFVPSAVYTSMPLAPENLTVESLGDTEFSAVLSWTNPVNNIHNEPLGTIDQVVVCRNEKPIHVFNNPAPGQAMSFTDHYLPTMVSYSVYAVSNTAKGFAASEDKVILGPSCTWTVEMSSSNNQGWKGNSLVFTDGMGEEIARLSLSNTNQTQTVTMPLSVVSISWKSSELSVDQIHFEIKDVDGTTRTSFDGSTSIMRNGVFYRATNACQNGDRIAVPSHLTADVRENDVLLQWQMEPTDDFVFFIYRDGRLYDLSETASYIDAALDNNFHSYHVTAFNGMVESDPSNSCNVQPASDYPSPFDLRYTILSDDKIRLSWNAPINSNVSGYKVYRRTKDEDFFHIKSTSQTSVEIKLNGVSCETYEFAVLAYYAQTHGTSSFASSQSDPSLNFVEVNKTIIPAHLEADVMEEGVKLSWQTAMLADSYSVYRNGELIAEGITESNYLDASAEYGQSYCYSVVGRTPQLISNPSNEIYVDWATMTVSETDFEQMSVYPNPTDGKIQVTVRGMRQIAVLNMLGQMVLTQEVSDDSITLDISTLRQGAYFLHVTAETGDAVMKIVKM